MNAEELKVFVDKLEGIDELQDAEIQELVKILNSCMLGNIIGPDCTDKDVCKDNCCSIMIDVPYILAEKYIDKGYLKPNQLRRGDIFAWKLNISAETDKCVFFSPEIFGCEIYLTNLAIRPPQCTVYPGGYIAGKKSCKGGAGPWKIIDVEVGQLCKKLMEIYKTYSLEERESFKKKLIKDIKSRMQNLKAKCKKVPPKTIVGIQDTWDGFIPLEAEGRSFAFKKFCGGCEMEFMNCNNVCDRAADEFIEFLLNILPIYIEQHDMLENYLIMELKRIND